MQILLNAKKSRKNTIESQYIDDTINIYIKVMYIYIIAKLRFNLTIRKQMDFMFLKYCSRYIDNLNVPNAINLSKRT